MRDKSVGTMPMLPFASLVANCAIWTWYGALLNEGAGDTTVMLPNASGLCVGIIASAIYLKYSPSKQIPLVAGTIGIVGAVSAAAMTMPSAEVLPYIGYLGDLLAVILMASPLSTMRSVIQEKSTRSMALPISVVRGSTCLPWGKKNVNHERGGFPFLPTHSRLPHPPPSLVPRRHFSTDVAGSATAT